jgi:ubiquinone biosynthesis protein Coq4
VIEGLYDIEEGLQQTKATHFSICFLKSQPDVAEIMAERFLAVSPSTDELLSYPQSSLGYAYGMHIRQANLNPNFYRSVEVVDDATYLFQRLRQTHDIWHVVTGFGIDGLGEMELKAFEFAQTRRPMAAVLIGLVILGNVFKQPHTLGALFEHMASAYQLGTQAKPFLAQKWEEHWDRPVAEWRSRLLPDV